MIFDNMFMLMQNHNRILDLCNHQYVIYVG